MGVVYSSLRSIINDSAYRSSELSSTTGCIASIWHLFVFDDLRDWPSLVECEMYCEQVNLLNPGSQIPNGCISVFTVPGLQTHQWFLHSSLVLHSSSSEQFLPTKYWSRSGKLSVIVKITTTNQKQKQKKKLLTAREINSNVIWQFGVVCSPLHSKSLSCVRHCRKWGYGHGFLTSHRAKISNNFCGRNCVEIVTSYCMTLAIATITQERWNIHG